MRLCGQQIWGTRDWSYLGLYQLIASLVVMLNCQIVCSFITEWSFPLHRMNKQEIMHAFFPSCPCCDLYVTYIALSFSYLIRYKLIRQLSVEGLLVFVNVKLSFLLIVDFARRTGTQVVFYNIYYEIHFEQHQKMLHICFY